MNSNCTCVCLLRSKFNPGQIYFGTTRDPGRRLTDHNGGKIQTPGYRPW